jgi:hypothetical protein
MSHEAALYGSGGNGANWHPSRAFHMLRGEMIVWLYSLIFYDMIDMVVEDLKSFTPEQLQESEFQFRFFFPCLFFLSVK